MEAPEFEHPLMPSVLDRLTGEPRPTQEELERNKAYWIGRKKAMIQRDLQNLFNTRWQVAELNEEWDELPLSIVRVGIPDFTGANATSLRNREDFLETLRGCIQRYEPRLRNIRLELLDPRREPVQRELRFRIHAVMSLEHEVVEFVSTMEPTSGTFSVRGE